MDQDVTESQERNHGDATGVNTVLLIAAGVASAFVYATETWLSFDCEQSDLESSRPLLAVIGLLSVAGIVWLMLCWRIIRPASGSRTQATTPAASATQSQVTVIVAFAILFRIILLFSIPIQEVDLYRYIWDGTVVSQGISPWTFSPEEVVSKVRREASQGYRRSDLQQHQLARLAAAAGQPGLKRVMNLVHFERYTTPYPATNQPVFAVAAILGSAFGTFYGYLVSMKFILCLFDLGTGWLLIRLLRHLSLPTQWSIAWLWCPLVLKEFANSGHLDSIAVFFTLASVYLVVVSLWPRTSVAEAAETEIDRSLFPWLFVAGVAVLALATGAKIYPVVLAPLIAVAGLRRLGWRSMVAWPAFLVLSAALLWPMVRHTGPVMELTHALGMAGDDREAINHLPPSGIEAFVRRWEMNDFLFMVIIENLKPYGNEPADRDRFAGDWPSRIWFVKTTNGFRHSFADRVAAWASIPKADVAFWLTRRITLALFCGVVLFAITRMVRSPDATTLLKMVFLTIAWFWLLSPTQNPWYWTWAVPFVAFARSRIWLLIAVTVMAYYLRFWCDIHLNQSDGFMGTPYAGTAFFDFVMPVVEFLPVLLLLLAGVVWRKGRIGFQPVRGN